MRRIGKWALRLGLILVVVIGSVFWWSSRRSVPQIDGAIELAGLDGPVDVIRDSAGVPHIYATTSHDLFMAQGFVHAQDRFWQMDAWRHIGAGRLAEMFGESQLETDAFLRTMGWYELAEQQYEDSGVESQQMLDAYAEGVNAYIGDRSEGALGLEYGVLGLINGGYEIEPWAPPDTLVWGKVMAWELRSNLGDEIDRSMALSMLTPLELEALYPPYPPDHPLIVGANKEHVTGETVNPAPVSGLGSSLVSLYDNVERNFALIDKLAPGGDSGIGSNSWVVGPELSSTGSALLANDPHLGIQMPSIWYQVALHCSPVTAACPYSVGGFSFAGVPGIIIGHNENIAWGFTNLGPDVADLFIEKLNPDNPNQYEFEGEWRDMEVRTETIHSSSGSEELTIRSTHHGPIISEVYGPTSDLETESGLELPDNFAISIQWTALDETESLSETIRSLNLASNFDEFRAALESFDVPSQNVVYADTLGNIGYQAPGLVPIRAAGNGRTPVPGWTGEFEWTGYVPYEELPFVYNPPEGYIVTANNAVIDGSYPYLLTTDWNYGYRADRIDDLLNAAAPVSPDDMAAIQFDSHNETGKLVVPFLTSLEVDEGVETEALAELAAWDFQNSHESTAAAIFASVWRALLTEAFADDLPPDQAPFGGGRWMRVTDLALEQPDHWLWDNRVTDATERRDDVLLTAFKAGVAHLVDEVGDDPEDWSWGELHGATFENQTLGQSGVGPVEMLFNRGPQPTGGGGDLVNATAWDASAEDFSVTWVPSMRMVIDMGDLDAAITMHTTGQSGHAYSRHYDDLMESWANGDYYPMWWNRSSVEANAEGTLNLTP